MASQTTAPTSPPSAHLVAKLFVEKYYSMLHNNPEEVHKFYHDSSVLSRPNLDGVMKSVTTMQGIDESVRSLDYKSFKIEIVTVDSQHSYNDGVLLLVTGCLTGKGYIRQKFTQSFFLAPQENGGYFVLNDVFRYVADSLPMEVNHVPINGSKDAVGVSLLQSPDPESPAADIQHHISEDAHLLTEKETKNNKKAHNPTENGGSVVEAVDQPVPQSQNKALPAHEVATSGAEEDTPKKSYASIVKVMTGNTTSPIVSVPATKTRVVKKSVTLLPAPQAETQVTDVSKAPENSNPTEEVEGHSIYIRNLPLNAMPSQLEAEFKKFGPIKPGGVQVRNHKQHGYCFGFIEFESLSSMQSAIEASPVSIAGQQAFVEEKRTTTRVGSGNCSSAPSGRGRFPLARGGYRNDNFRGRGGFGGGQGYGRNEFRSRGDLSNRGHGPAGRASEGYQQVVRPNTMKLTTVSA